MASKTKLGSIYQTEQLSFGSTTANSNARMSLSIHVSATLPCLFGKFVEWFKDDITGGWLQLVF